MNPADYLAPVPGKPATLTVKTSLISVMQRDDDGNPVGMVLQPR